MISALRIAIAIGAAALASAACASDRSDETPSAGAGHGDALATVGDAVITTADVERRLAGLSPYERARYTSLEQRRELLDNMIRFEVLAQEAQRRGFDEHPDVVRTVKELMIQRMMEDKLGELDPGDIPTEELRAFYEARADEFHRPEEVRASVIVLRDRGRAEAILEDAQDASPRRFRELVEAHSIDAKTRERGGDLRYFTRDTEDLPQPLIDAAFSAGPGEVKGPIDGGDGSYLIVKRTGHRPAIERTFEDVIPQIRNRVYRKQRAEAQAKFLEELRAATEIDIREDALEAIELPPSGGAARAEPADPARRPPDTSR